MIRMKQHLATDYIICCIKYATFHKIMRCNKMILIKPFLNDRLPFIDIRSILNLNSVSNTAKLNTGCFSLNSMLQQLTSFSGLLTGGIGDF